jgi:hypothetical protein
MNFIRSQADRSDSAGRVVLENRVVRFFVPGLAYKSQQGIAKPRTISVRERATCTCYGAQYLLSLSDQLVKKRWRFRSQRFAKFVLLRLSADVAFSKW